MPTRAILIGFPGRKKEGHIRMARLGIQVEAELEPYRDISRASILPLRLNLDDSRFNDRWFALRLCHKA
jgi:hypothetical protein